MTTYKSSGVDIKAADLLVENNIKSLAKSTTIPGVMNSIGGFGSVFDLKQLNMVDPLMITTTDGVGTKLLIAIEANNFKGIGQDLVAMCVNDLIATGATPKVFLDYYATGKLDINISVEIIQSIAAACIQSNCSLVGGETAEMPGMYKAGDIDLAGFSVGFVERENLLPKTLSSGDIIIGLPSSGIHSNGFSLVRSIIKQKKLKLDDPCSWNDNVSLAEGLLVPTELYVEPVLHLQKLGILKAAAHITGGGIVANLERVIDDNHRAVIVNEKPIPILFNHLKQLGKVSDEEMLKVFNCGLGMVVIVDNDKQAMDYLLPIYPTCRIIGQIEDRKGRSKVNSYYPLGLY